ncbi:hypothetical protein KFL_005680130 [Klebsormidium nitens]|uniref:Uncharacterized protein n=1 Tax=Klebsormidium nitens TaxID=105231 RepID=A0A1Y1IG74_KLENI|nr:hypothetical protein KFL_005680130 [Klebsormidium nitens]|eukprot:GAQ89844.1 hypothetical protein KFL_005680130 [Klebsormidium nitens]
MMQEAWPYVTRLASEFDDIFFLMPFTWKQLVKPKDQRTPADVPIIAVPIDAEDYPVPNRVPGSILFRIEVQNRLSDRDNGSLWVELPAEKDFPLADLSDSQSLGSSNAPWDTLYSRRVGVGTSNPQASLHVANGDARFDSNVTINGRLDVKGPINYVTSTDLLVEDRTITLAQSDSPSDVNADGAGIRVMGDDFADDPGAISFTWNDVDGGVWLAKGGAVGLQAGSNQIRFTGGGAGGLRIVDEDSSTVAFDMPIVPVGSNTLGTASDAWETLYANTGHFYQLGSADDPLQSLYTSVASIKDELSVDEGGTITLSADVLSGSNGTYDLGSDSNTWKSVHAVDATLSGPLIAGGATLSGDLDMRSNSISCSGDLGSLNDPLQTLYTSVASIKNELSVDEGGTITLSADVLSGIDATLSGPLTAGGATLSGDLDMGSNSISCAGNLGTLASLAAETADLGSLEVSEQFNVRDGSTTSLAAPLIPGSNNQYDVGSVSNSWRTVYASNATLAGSLTARGASLSAPISLGNNGVTLTGQIASSSSRASALYSSVADVNTSLVNSNLTLQPGSTTNLSADLQPGSNSTFSLGSSNSSWKTLYASNAILSAGLTCKGVDTQGSNITVGSGSLTGASASVSNLTVNGGGSTAFYTSLTPGSNGAYDIGSASVIWRNVYASNLTVTGTLNLSSNATTSTQGSPSSRVAVYGTTVDANYVVINNDLTVGSGATTNFATSLLPGSNGIYNIGAAGNAWNAIYGSNVTLSGQLKAASGITSSNGLTVAAGSASFGSNVSVAGPLTVAGGLTSSNGLSVAAGTASFGSNVAVSGPLVASGGLTSSNGLTVAAGSASFGSNVSITGPLTAAGGLTSSNGLSVSAGTAAFGSNVAVSGPLTASAGTASFGSNLSVTGAASFGSNVGVSGPLVASGGLTSSNGLTVAAGSASFGSNVSVTGPLTAAGGLTSSNGLSVSAGTATFGSNVSISGPLTASGGITSSNGLTVSAGTATFGSNLVASGTITGSNGLTVAGGSVSFASNLTVAGAIVSSNGVTGSSFSTTGAISAGTGNFSGDVTVSGNFNVGGRIDYVSTSELLVADKHITLASSSNPTDALASGAGLYIQGSNYAASNSTISLTWNTGANGNYWLTMGGNVALQGTSGSKMVTLSTASDGSLKLLSDDGTTATSTAAFGVPLIPASSALDIGSSSNLWGTLYASSVGSASKLVPVFASTISCSNLTATAAVTGGSLSAGAGSLTAGAATLGALSCTTISTNNCNISVGTGSITAGAVTFGAVTCGSIGTQGNSISAGVISCTGVSPGASNSYDVGSSSLTWRNAYFAGTVSASTYSGLTRKYWNKYNMGLINETTGYHKIATLLPWTGANNSVLRLSGQFGGEAAFAVLDMYISTRPTPLTVSGTAYGNLAAAKAYGDIAIYLETSSNYSVYLSSTKQFGSWDLSVEGSSGNVLLEPSASNTAAPTGTLQTPSPLSQLNISTELSTKVTTLSTNLSCSNLTAAGTFSLGPLTGSYSNAAGPFVVSAGFDAVGSNHSIPLPPGERNQAGILTVFAKNLNGSYGGSKAGYLRIFYSSLAGDVNNAFGVIESYAPRMTTFSATANGQGCTIATDADCAVAYKFEGAC